MFWRIASPYFHMYNFAFQLCPFRYSEHPVTLFWQYLVFSKYLNSYFFLIVCHCFIVAISSWPSEVTTVHVKLLFGPWAPFYFPALVLMFIEFGPLVSWGWFSSVQWSQRLAFISLCLAFLCWEWGRDNACYRQDTPTIRLRSMKAPCSAQLRWPQPNFRERAQATGSLWRSSITWYGKSLFPKGSSVVTDRSQVHLLSDPGQITSCEPQFFHL